MMPALHRIGLGLAGLLMSSMMLVGCSTEHIHEPWVNAQQRELVEEELDRDPETAAQLRDRLERGQDDR